MSYMQALLRLTFLHVACVVTQLVTWSLLTDTVPAGKLGRTPGGNVNLTKAIKDDVEKLQ